MSSVGLFEFVRHWLLYADLAAKWTADSRLGFYLLRGDVLRAQVSAGHPLALGYLIAIAFGFWLYLQTSIKSSRTRLSVAILYWLGLLAAYSRGPWIGAVVIYFIFAALGRRAFFRLFKSLGIVALVAAGILLSPLGERIIQVLPFMGGSVDSGSTLYRQRLAERSWELILENPFFGDQLAYWKMEDLRQGQGIIDLVNTYAEVALFYGIVGLALFAGFILVGLVKAYGKAKENLASDPNLASLGFVLAACILGTLLMISTCSFIFGYAKMFYVLAGLAAAYTQIRQQPESNTQAQVRPAEIAEPY
jgi:O-antigen ligase